MRSRMSRRYFDRHDAPLKSNGVKNQECQVNNNAANEFWAAGESIGQHCMPERHTSMPCQGQLPDLPLWTTMKPSTHSEANSESRLNSSARLRLTNFSIACLASSSNSDLVRVLGLL